MNASKPLPERLFIVGTDTGVGKSVASLLIMRHLYRSGRRPFYIKPFQTGCRDAYDTDSDAAFVYRHTEALRGADPADSVIYCHRNPKAPLFAARDDDDTIDLGRIDAFAAEKARLFSPLVFEAAGGIFVPVTETVSVADLVARVGATPILVARAGLGTINHALLTCEALDRRGIAPMGILFLDGGETPTPPAMIRENIEAVERGARIPVVGVIDRISGFDAIPAEADAVMERLFASYAL